MASSGALALSTDLPPESLWLAVLMANDTDLGAFLQQLWPDDPVAKLITSIWPEVFRLAMAESVVSHCYGDDVATATKMAAKRMTQIWVDHPELQNELLAKLAKGLPIEDVLRRAATAAGIPEAWLLAGQPSSD